MIAMTVLQIPAQDVILLQVFIKANVFQVAHLACILNKYQVMFTNAQLALLDVHYAQEAAEPHNVQLAQLATSNRIMDASKLAHIPQQQMVLLE